MIDDVELIQMVEKLHAALDMALDIVCLEYGDVISIPGYGDFTVEELLGSAQNIIDSNRASESYIGGVI